MGGSWIGIADKVAETALSKELKYGLKDVVGWKDDAELDPLGTAASAAGARETLRAIDFIDSENRKFL